MIETSLSGLLAWGREQLRDKPSDSPNLDVELLLLSVMKIEGLSKKDLYIRPDTILPKDNTTRFIKMIQRRALGEPVASILGHQGFWSLDLWVSKDTLIPRPETELLVEIILEKGQQNYQSVLDLGTGTGAIALALAKERPNWLITATDIHPETLEMAQKNAQLNHLEQVVFKLGAWFEAVSQSHFSIIVSNPPYIAEGDPHLNHPALSFEPKRALVSGPTGLNDITKIIQQAPLFLEEKGLLLLEHGYDQKEAVQALFKEAGFLQIETRKDLAGLDRVTFGVWNKLKVLVHFGSFF